eukprot:scpid37894/ scgid21678/ Methylcrotonoyl-CoA carboxylase subunit alpha, mitochondrial; 3-methylcrotonyl-CoA carboxylase 1; 3-methylcrotonyl-CoA carboxylase biotin-containing subunit; 3-methylcrotonyl-CoA:carbon dioxide ligase subunit alpha
MDEAGVPIIKGYHGQEQSVSFLREQAQQIGYPVMLKAVMGGGGKGMRIARSDDDFEWQLQQAKDEAMSAFNDDRMIMEQYVERTRHVEVQVFADTHGNTVYLFERDCSVQRRHQKIIEESPAPDLTDEDRRQIGEAAVRAAKAVGYVGAGTVEFLMDADKKFYFMEMNTRLQVEHPVTEMVTRTDLVEWQLKVAAGEPLALQQSDIRLHGHAFEARVYAEKTGDGPDGPTFMPSSGNLFYISPPETSSDVRVDTGVVQGDDVLTFYDPMIAKLVVWAPDRLAALEKLRQSLRQYHIVGPSTNIGFLDRLAGNEEFAAGRVHTDFIPEQGRKLCSSSTQLHSEAIAQASLFLLLMQDRTNPLSQDSFSPFQSNSAARLNMDRSRHVRLADGETLVNVRAEVAGDEGYQLHIERVAKPAAKPAKKPASPAAPLETDTCHVDGVLSKLPGEKHGWLLSARVDGKLCKLTGVIHDGTLHLFTENGEVQVPLYKPGFVGSTSLLQDSGNVLFPPLNGKVIKVLCQSGDKVEKDTVLVVIEAMKMKYEMRAPRNAVVDKVMTHEGNQVTGKTALVTFVEESEEVD